VRIIKWSEVETEQLSPLLSRQMVHCDALTIAKINLTKGSVVPRHQHVNEQVTMVETGKLNYRFDDREFVLEAGESMIVPPNVAHEVTALEDTLAIDIFTPVREDWKRGDDAYLRQR
jgi:quercetin dioxygenase-like cupin family protein